MLYFNSLTNQKTYDFLQFVYKPEGIALMMIRQTKLGSVRGRCENDFELFPSEHSTALISLPTTLFPSLPPPPTSVLILLLVCSVLIAAGVVLQRIIFQVGFAIHSDFLRSLIF